MLACVHTPLDGGDQEDLAEIWVQSSVEGRHVLVKLFPDRNSCEEAGVPVTK